MPKFYKRNKKRIDPRYFLDETIDRDRVLLEEDSLEEGEGCGQNNENCRDGSCSHHWTGGECNSGTLKDEYKKAKETIEEENILKEGECGKCIKYSDHWAASCRGLQGLRRCTKDSEGNYQAPADCGC